MPRPSSIVAFVCLAAVPFFAARGEAITLDGAKCGKTFEDPCAVGCDYEPVKFTALQVTAQAKR